MKTNTITAATATATATALFTCATSSHNLTLAIATLCNEAAGDFKAAGVALADAWQTIGGDVDSCQATRHLVESCFATSMERKQASKFLNAVGLVSKQRISQLLAVVYDGDKSKNKGKAKEKNGGDGGESQDGLDKNEGKGFTFEQILAAIKSLPSITKEQAQVAAATLAAKIA